MRRIPTDVKTVYNNAIVFDFLRKPIFYLEIFVPDFLIRSVLHKGLKFI